MAKQHDKQFKLDAIQYYEDHKLVHFKSFRYSDGEQPFCL